MQVFKESVRDSVVKRPVNAAVNEAATAALEICHIMSGFYKDGGLMAQSVGGIALSFTATTYSYG